jgi:hypothetical protein
MLASLVLRLVGRMPIGRAAHLCTISSLYRRANFLERRTGEVPRIYLLRGWVNKGKR